MLEHISVHALAAMRGRFDSIGLWFGWCVQWRTQYDQL